MHRLAALPGDPGEGDAVLVEQESLPALVLSHADSDLSLIAQRLSAAGDPAWMRGLNLAALSHPAAIDHYIRSSLASTRLVVVRLLGGRGHWSYGLEQLREWAAQSPQRALLVLGGTADGAEELADLSSEPATTALALASCLRHGGPDNIDAVLLWCQRWLAGAAPSAPEPQPQPDPLCFDWQTDDGPTVGVVAYRALWSSGDTAMLQEIAACLRRAGLCPRILLVSGLRDPALQQAVRDHFCQAAVEAVICCTGFASVQADRAGDGAPLWQQLGVPVIQLLISSGSQQRWQSSSVGLSPLDLAMQVALPELDGRLMARIGGFKELAKRDDALQCAIQRYQPDPAGVAWSVELIKRWIALRHTPEPTKRIALVLANYPTRNARLANGVGLDTPASAVAILLWLQQEGYWLGEDPIPATSAELIAELSSGRTPDPETWHHPASEHLMLADYDAIWSRFAPEARQAVLERWGDPTTDPTLDGDRFPLSAKRYGNVTVILQPSRGYDRDPSLNYHAPDLAPTHAYLAHYIWIQRHFDAHAVIHLGKHGNLEWLPGKGMGQSPACFPQLCLGPMPHLYPFIVNDPGEGSQAKRRSQALILDHLTPPLGRAGLHGPLAELEGLVDEYWEAIQLGSERRKLLRQRLEQSLRELNLNPSEASFEERLDSVDGYLCELKEAQIRTGLHIYGRQPEQPQLDELVLAIARCPGPGRLGLTRALAEDLALECDPWTDQESIALSAADQERLVALQPNRATPRQVGDAVEVLEQLALQCLQGSAAYPGEQTRQAFHHIQRVIQPALMACSSSERRNLLAGLRGERVEAGPSGAPTRGRADVLPTGRNFYAVDLRGVPTETAWDLGYRSADALLQQHLQQEGEHLKHLAISIWGTSTMRTGGDDVAQVLALMGVRPRWDGPSRRMVGLELIPESALGRPRVEVTVRISGFFRDAFPQLIGWLNQADQLVRAQQGDPSQRMCAIYGSAPGAYGAGLQGLIDSGQWDERSDLAEAFLNWSQWDYGKAGEPLKDRSGLEDRLRQVELILHNQDNREHDLLDSDDYYQFQGGLAAAVGTLKGETPALWFGDHSRPERPKPKPLQQELDKVIRSRLLNPRWIQGMAKHGYKGGFELAASLDYLFAYDACTNVVPDWAYSEVCKQWLQSEAVLNHLRTHNPWALRDMAERLLEANNRGLWESADPQQLDELRALVLSSEQQIETGNQR